MTLQDLFDELLTERTVVVELDKSQAESLRVALSKKWSKYRKLMDSCGFLEKELEGCSLCRSGPVLSNPESTVGAYTFSLAKVSRPAIQYTVLPSTPPESKNHAPV